MITKELHFRAIGIRSYELVKMVNVELNKVLEGIPIELGYVYNQGAMETLHREIMKMPGVKIVMEVK